MIAAFVGGVDEPFYRYQAPNKGPVEPHPDDFNHPDQKAKRAAKKAARKAKAALKGETP